MPQFPVTPERQRTLERIPDYEVRLEPESTEVTVTHAGRTLATTTAALLVSETRHGDVYYLPRADVNLDLFEATDLSTFCPFKGHASYWTLRAADGKDAIENVVWSYKDPYPEVAGLKDYMSFDGDRVDVRAGSA